ncbi:MAG: hypothetical protein WCS42_19450 [Verrucomicrobiota bacterium]
MKPLPILILLASLLLDFHAKAVTRVNYTRGLGGLTWDSMQGAVQQSKFDQWRLQRNIETFNDLHWPSGITTLETRILPPASGQLNQFLINPQ